MDIILFFLPIPNENKQTRYNPIHLMIFPIIYRAENWLKVSESPKVKSF